MRVAFYAPLKAPTSPRPSGDRRMAQLIMRAIGQGGHDVSLASALRTFDGVGDAAVQRQLKMDAEGQIEGILEAIQEEAIPKPDIWFTYHLYHKAPDWLGPAIADVLKIPYVVAEASYAPKQAGGAWDLGHRAAERALHRADLVIGLNPVDSECVRALMTPEQRYETIAPFIDIAPYTQAVADRRLYRAMAAGQYGMDANVPWLMTAAMMRRGDKQRSYLVLAEALADLTDHPWHLLIAGDGEAREEIHRAFDGLHDRISWLGGQDSENLAGLYAASDLYVWPAVNEAFGVSFLEAQAAGLPVVAGDSGGVSGVVHAPAAGTLVPVNDPGALRMAVREMLGTPDIRKAKAHAAQRLMAATHSLEVAAPRIGQLISEVHASCG